MGKYSGWWSVADVGCWRFAWFVVHHLLLVCLVSDNVQDPEESKFIQVRHVGMRCQPVFRVGLLKFVPILQECFVMQRLKKVTVPCILMANRMT